MCGITGYFYLSPQSQNLSVDLQQMNQQLFHRGPDESGQFENGRVGLAMRRLSIIDLATGQQPMTNETQTIQVVFNGEIYNYRELRDELAAQGHHFQTQSDTEVLVHGYEQWGEQLPKHLRGMFAFAVWDSEPQKLMLARDHFGIKPLYYAVVNHTLLFASEIKSLLIFSHREIDLIALDQYLTALYIPEPRTIFQSIKALPAGHLLTAQHDLQIQKYWSFVPMQNPYPTKEAALEAIREVVADSVQKMLVADVPLGAFLSGGIDSASVVAMMSRFQAQVETFSIGFGDKEYRCDELDAARQIARFFKTNHHEFRVTPDVITLLPEIIPFFDQPFANPTALLLYILSGETRQFVKVALAGTGGDEMFGGYVRYKGMQRYEQYARLPLWSRKLMATAADTLIHDDVDGRLGRQRVRRFLQGGAQDFDDAYLYMVSTLKPDEKKFLYSSKMPHGDSWAFVRDSLTPTGDYSRLETLMTAELHSYLPFNQLVYNDRMSMAKSLEVRVPLVDQQVVEVAGNIPLSWKIQNGVTKSLFREAMSPFLPPEILHTPKLGLNLPISLWFQQELREWVEDNLSPARVQQRGYFQPETVHALI
ncbi:MAG: asparagine synthase (glutamine-hydrolyzing), partial [Anaerolineae bacterium]|nr:asparagine synthase (glutamine-hydrolyzing) [Anaerolineae bacterium]